jgi:hypothetical protein
MGARVIESGSVLGYIGNQELTSAASIAMDVTEGRRAFIDTLGHDATVTLSNIEDGETVEVAIIQDGTGSRSFTFAHATLTIIGLTTAIAGLGAGLRGTAVATRVGTELWVEAREVAV